MIIWKAKYVIKIIFEKMVNNCKNRKIIIIIII